MSVPGFSGEMSLYPSREHYRSSMSGISAAHGEVLPQLRIGGGGGGLGFHWPNRCNIACFFAAVACNVGCAGTGPGYVACLVACGAAEVACLAACGGGLIGEPGQVLI